MMTPATVGGARKGVSVKTLKRTLKKAGLKTTGRKAALTRRARKARLMGGVIGDGEEVVKVDPPVGGRRRRGSRRA